MSLKLKIYEIWIFRSSLKSLMNILHLRKLANPTPTHYRKWESLTSTATNSLTAGIAKRDHKKGLLIFWHNLPKIIPKKAGLLKLVSIDSKLAAAWKLTTHLLVKRWPSASYLSTISLLNLIKTLRLKRSWRMLNGWSNCLSDPFRIPPARI